MHRLNDATNIKALLIDFFLMDTSYDLEYLFGSEIMYGKNKRSSDLVLINGSVTGFEIKAENDNLTKVRSQLNDYKKVFDRQYLVVTENHLVKAFGIIKPNEGLIVVKQDGTIKVLKPSEKLTRQTKEDLLESMPLAYLKSIFKLPSLLNAFEARRILKRRSLDEIKTAFKEFLTKILEPRNEVFLSEKGTITHFEDIRLLSNNKSTII